MSSEITIAVLFFGVILLMICSVAFKPATKVFVGVISVLGAFLIIMTWMPVILAPALVILAPTLIVWWVVRVRNKKAWSSVMRREGKD